MILTTFMVIGILFIAGMIFSIFMIYVSTKFNKVLLPGLSLLIISILEWPVKVLVNKHKVDKAIIKLTNRLYENKFKELEPEDVLIFLPICIRHLDCPARLSQKGIECVDCGNCNVGKFKKNAEAKGYKVFIAPGSSLVKRMIIKHKPKGVLGVGCHIEIKEGMKMVSHYGMIPQSVPLLKEGCVCTEVDWKEIEKKLK